MSNEHRLLCDMIYGFQCVTLWTKARCYDHQMMIDVSTNPLKYSLESSLCYR